MKNKGGLIMKRLVALLLLLCTFVLFLSSCGDQSAIAKPEDTNLEYWLFDKPDKDNMTEILSNHMQVRYIAAGYTEESQGGCVYYETHRYSNRVIGKHKIDVIIIEDPEVTMWGIDINSSYEEIKKALTKVGFDESSYEEYSTYTYSHFEYKDKDGIYHFDINYGRFIRLSYSRRNYVNEFCEKTGISQFISDMYIWLVEHGF
jgi:hypothetical protein